jgi:predicted HNH restriction endonuclease
MKSIDKVYKTIKEKSVELIEESSVWKKELSSAKNYICSPDMKHWTFGKSAAQYQFGGGQAKQWLYAMGFTNVLDLKNEEYKNKVIQSFLLWAKKVESFDITAKFKRDQKQNKRFELLIHESLLNKQLQVEINIIDKTQQRFDEGFRTEIVREVASRDKRLIDLAKNKYGTKCMVCHFDFAKMYGSHGEGFIEVHHLFPISKGKRNTKVEDLRPVCANCHRMLHRGVAMLSIEELKEIIKTK